MRHAGLSGMRLSSSLRSASASASLTEIPQGSWMREVEGRVRSFWLSLSADMTAEAGRARFNGLRGLALRKFMTPPMSMMNYPDELISASRTVQPNQEEFVSDEGKLSGDSSALWLSSTMKKRAMKMNKHKLKKRRKSLRMNTKKSRG